MRTTKIKEHLYLVDVETAGMKNFIGSYILKGKRAAIIETGPTSSIPNLISGLRELDIKMEDVAYVAVSHIHLDHGGGVGTLLKFLPKAKVVVHQRGAPHLANPEKLWQQSKEVLGDITKMYGEPEPVPEGRIIAASDGMTFDLGDNVKFTVVETVGHASHHLSYYEPLGRGVFAGDAAGIYLKDFDVTVPTTPSLFRLDMALNSLDRLISLKPEVSYYSHFGVAHNALDKLHGYAEQLKLWARIAKQGVREGKSLEAISECIVEGDEAMRRVKEYVKAHPVLSVTVLRDSVQGVVDFVGKFADFVV
ncbi:MAG: MBL fold metallo-hydrolase [Candidatus Bathyarchaeia archaeon]